ncbi:hypothetical protein [Nonomuraea fuscirosea]|uniref:hypothetical protein n=1 Tax=Nonomuraea fuscirosea TaxID=1291556 RepID=UPI003443B706
MMIRRRTHRSAGRIDVARLPEDVLALINDLEPGETLAITREGESIATITSTIRVVNGAIVDPDASNKANDHSPSEYDSATVVATAMKLSAKARVALSTQLGTDYVVLDMHAAPATADVLLVPPISAQLLSRLRSRFPKARVIVTEIEDHELGIQYHGPVHRLLEAGADAYLPPASLPLLARQLDYTLHHGREIAGGVAMPMQIAPAMEPADPDDG